MDLNSSGMKFNCAGKSKSMKRKTKFTGSCMPFFRHIRYLISMLMLQLGNKMFYP